MRCCRRSTSNSLSSPAVSRSRTFFRNQSASKAIPEPDNASPQQHRNIIKLREDAKSRYFDAPDLQGVGKNGYRFINAISDFSTHAKPLRERANYKESLFSRTVEGHPMIDKAYQMVLSAA